MIDTLKLTQFSRLSPEIILLVIIEISPIIVHVRIAGLCFCSAD